MNVLKNAASAEKKLFIHDSFTAPVRRKTSKVARDGKNKAKPNLVDIRAPECGRKLKIWWLLLSRSESFLSGLSFQHTVFSFAQSWKCAMEHLCVYLVGACWWWCRWCWWCWATHGGRSPPLAAALVGWLRRQGANRQQPKSIPTCCRTSTEAGGRPVPGRGGLLDQ